MDCELDCWWFVSHPWAHDILFHFLYQWITNGLLMDIARQIRQIHGSSSSSSAVSVLIPVYTCQKQWIEANTTWDQMEMGQKSRKSDDGWVLLGTILTSDLYIACVLYRYSKSLANQVSNSCKEFARHSGEPGRCQRQSAWRASHASCTSTGWISVKHIKTIREGWSDDPPSNIHTS